MAKKILISYDFSKLESLNFRLQNLVTDPQNPVEGLVYWNTASKYLAVHNGTSFINILNRANHTGTQAWSTIQSTPTTLQGYGITDAAPSTHVGQGGTAHANAVASGAAGFMTGADKAKLDGIASGATANSQDSTLLQRANHTGTQTASTISDFNTAVRTSTLNQMQAPTADLSLANYKITSLADGVQASDAVNYGQLQAIATSRQFKDAVRCATTANIALTGLQTIDGITVVAGDRVLVKDQTTAQQNGIYVVSQGAWSRSTDTDNTQPDTEVKTGMTVLVQEGTTYADKQLTLTTNGQITVGTTALAFAITGAGTTYTQGTGINISGSVIGIDTAVTVRKYAQNIGDGQSVNITVTHGLSTLDVQVQVVEVQTGATVECDVTRSSTTQVTLGFAVAPATNAYRVLVQG